MLPLLSQGININGSEIELLPIQIGEVKSGTFKEIVPSLRKFLHLFMYLLTSDCRGARAQVMDLRFFVSNKLNNKKVK